MDTKMKAIIVIVIIAAGGVVALVAFGPLFFPTPPSVAIVFATGGLGDKSFNDGCYAGAMRAKTELGANFTYVEPLAIADYEGYHIDYAAEGYDLIIGIGYDQAAAINDTAKDNPGQKFAIVDMVVDQPDVASLVFEEHEGSALVGIVAGMTTTTGKIGFIGGLDIPLINKFAGGYVWGANYSYYAENSAPIDFDVQYTNDWVDTTAGQTIADAMYAADADVIFAAAGRSGLGVFDSADTQGAGHYVIGVDVPQMYLLPGQVITSMLKRVDVAVYEVIKAVMYDTFDEGIALPNGGILNIFTLANGGIDYEVNATLYELDNDIITMVEDVKDKIISGEIDASSFSDKYWL